jgi:hypothetical protein
MKLLVLTCDILTPLLFKTQASDPTHGTAQIRRFGMNSSMPTGGYTWFQGDVVAWGMRNAVGLAVSSDSSKLWTVENSADQLNYTSGSQLIDVHLVCTDEACLCVLSPDATFRIILLKK